MSGQRVAVAATGEQALAAGLGVAVDGGNAVDAAMAAAFVALSTEPGMVSFGGGAFVVGVAGRRRPGGRRRQRRDARPRGARVRLRRGRARGRSPTYGGGVVMHAGAGSVATPGIVPAFAVAHERYARLPWARLLRPAGDAPPAAATR